MYVEVSTSIVSWTFEDASSECLQYTKLTLAFCIVAFRGVTRIVDHYYTTS